MAKGIMISFRSESINEMNIKKLKEISKNSKGKLTVKFSIRDNDQNLSIDVESNQLKLEYNKELFKELNSISERVSLIK